MGEEKKEQIQILDKTMDSLNKAYQDKIKENDQNLFNALTGEDPKPDKIEVPRGTIDNDSRTKSNNSMAKRKTKMRKENFLKAIESTLGNVTLSCERVGIGRTTYYDWMRDDPIFKARVEQVPERVKDFVETALMKQIQEGTPSSTIFFLKTKARDRGYIERVETNIMAPDHKLQVEIVRRTPEEIQEEIKDEAKDDEAI